MDKRRDRWVAPGGHANTMLASGGGNSADAPVPLVPAFGEPLGRGTRVLAVPLAEVSQDERVDSDAAAGHQRRVSGWFSLRIRSSTVDLTRPVPSTSSRRVAFKCAAVL
ncbi:hypothetical protein H072_7147 [Dactylellina haptotyla CBS 200.50]|uniref:Uncharacterized protein n=1 Tax=Dactylellina haptotyla (strain CBS 200.50) TaxID=1284197 RepID=S8AD74_DACHA|nr:hypothetical protein H072_7147 [Dactylellina haptotyla CBS 200.50]